MFLKKKHFNILIHEKGIVTVGANHKEGKRMLLDIFSPIFGDLSTGYIFPGRIVCVWQLTPKVINTPNILNELRDLRKIILSSSTNPYCK